MSINFRTQTWVNGGVGHYTHQEDMYMNFFKKYIPNFKGGKVLEIGPGTGEFARRMIKEYDIEKYTVLDLEENVFDSVNFIKGKNLGIELDYVLPQNHTDLFGEEFDLIVSNVCIPETPKEYRESLLNNIIPNTKNSMIIGQLDGKWVNGSEYEDWIKGLFNNNFSNVVCELTPYKRCYALIGHNED